MAVARGEMPAGAMQVGTAGGLRVGLALAARGPVPPTAPTAGVEKLLYHAVPASPRPTHTFLLAHKKNRRDEMGCCPFRAGAGGWVLLVVANGVVPGFEACHSVDLKKIRYVVQGVGRRNLTKFVGCVYKIIF